jgi:hypothetical protein
LHKYDVLLCIFIEPVELYYGLSLAS